MLRRYLRPVILVAVSIVCIFSVVAGPAKAAEPELVLEVHLDPATRAFSAVAELAAAPAAPRYGLHKSLAVHKAEKTPAGRTRIEYGGTLPALDPAIDHRAVLQALPPMASAAGSFLPAGSGWYPAPEAPFTYRVELHVAGGQKGVVPGRLLREIPPQQNPDGTYQALFQHDVPAEGIALMAGPYVVGERMEKLADGRTVRLRTYFFEGMEKLSDPYLEDSARYVRRYGESIGPYPFSAFSVVASPLPTGFGMPTLTYLGARVLRLPFIRGTSLGHEVLHNWWGNGVRVDPQSGNWSEGLTTFMADYAFREEASDAAARDLRLGWLRDLAAAPAAAPLAEFRARTHGTAAVTGYAKSAMVFLMLRDLIGEEAFRKGIRAFWQAYRFRAAGWDELRGAFEKASGRPLEAFFDQWLLRSDAPEPAIRSARFLADERILELDLEQSSPPYSLRLPVELSWPKKKETVVVELGSKMREQVRIKVEAATRPDAVRLDPQLRVWRLLPREALPPILREWTLAPAPGLEIAGKDPAVRKAAEALAGRLFESPYEKVRLKRGAPPERRVLLVGLHAAVEARLRALGLPPPPAEVAGKGSARVWTIPETRVAVVSATDAASLEALQRPLPHYGAQSWLVFEGARALGRGAWPPTVATVPVR